MSSLPLSGPDAHILIAAAVYATALLAWLGVEDALTRRLRRLPMALLALPPLPLALWLPVPGLSFVERLAGAAIGLALALAVRLLLRKREPPALGGGDVRLLGAIGLWTGLSGIADAATVGLLLTLIVALPLALRRRSLRFGLPLGPGLALGAMATLWLQTAWACGWL